MSTISRFLDSFNSKETKRTYLYSIRCFFNFIHKNLKEIRSIDLLSYYDFLKSSGYKTSTQQLKLNSIRSLFNWILYRTTAGEDLGFKKDDIPKLDFKLRWNDDDEPFVREILTFAEIELVLEKLKKLNFRYYIIFYMLADTSMRANGLCNIKIDDIDFSNRAIKTKDKGKVRCYTFGSNLRLELINYVNMRKSINIDSEYLFINRKSKKESVNNIFDIFNHNRGTRNARICDILNGLEVEKYITPHCLRASFKTNRRNALQNDKDVEFFMQHGYDYKKTYLRYTDTQRLALFDKYEFL